MLSTHEYSHGWTRHGKWKWLFPDIYFFVHDRTHDCGTNHYRTHSRVLGLTAPRHSSIVRRMESSRRAHLKIGYDREEENVWKPSESTEKTTKRPRKTITLIINSGTCFLYRLLPPFVQKFHCRRKALLAPTNGHVINCDYLPGFVTHPKLEQELGVPVC
jgi:hypothetical protein